MRVPGGSHYPPSLTPSCRHHHLQQAKSFSPASFAVKPTPAPVVAAPEAVAASKRLSGVGGPVSRKYNTEDERIRAEASVEDTNARLENLNFDFSFGQ